MDVTELIDPLNEAQRDAVAGPTGHTLVVAGAGSGKTRVLVHRIAWLIRAEGVSPFAILAVTFTNKAAAEMRGRIEDLVGLPSSGLWVGTFHGLAHRLLRQHHAEADLPATFQILDSADQQRLVKRVIQEQGLDDSRWPVRTVQGFINARKDDGQRPDAIDDGGDPYQRTLVMLYRAYEEACRRAGLVDFAELLLRAFELWRENPDLLDHYRQRFRHILVDEFQDTNAIQYAWLRLLAGDSGTLFAVGDDDQSIYGWRGARVENIRRYERDFPGVRTVRLEQNYRSTGHILGAANHLIARNPERLGKELWTAIGEGEPVQLYDAFNENDEARFVARRIHQWMDDGGRRDDCAILYRSNAQSRIFEEVMVQTGTPYRIYGGPRFFERAEIKDLLAYLRLAVNTDDDAAFERIVNTPTRGIGSRTVDGLRELARARGISLWRATGEALEENHLPARAAGAVRRFRELVEGLAEAMVDRDLGEQVDRAREASGLVAHYRKEKGEKGQARIDNLDELINAARAFEVEQAPDADEALSAFLNHAALEAGDAQADAGEDCIHMMTLHSAKGLEFPLVFLVGMEEGLFPHRMALDDGGRLEEERRLCYVGMTRAMRLLYLCRAESRRLHGKEERNRPSRFLGELPPEHTESVRLGGGAGSAAGSPAGEGMVVELGQRVHHPSFGPGVVMDYEGQGANVRIYVNFDEVGSKWLVLAYAQLEAGV
ncbi:MAG: DNA helicase II [Pseudomonadota bacterium]